MKIKLYSALQVIGLLAAIVFAFLLALEAGAFCLAALVVFGGYVLEKRDLTNAP